MGKILIKNGRVWDGEKFFFADVLTVDDRIAQIAPDITDSGAYLFDASGMTVSAGFVDIHVHMLISPSDAFGIQAEMSAFPFGVTAVADAGRVEGDKARLEACAVKNLLFVSAQIKDNCVDIGMLDECIGRYGERAVGIKVYFVADKANLTNITSLERISEYAKERGLSVMVHCTDSPEPMSRILGVLNEGDILTHSFHGGINNASEDGFRSMLEAQKRGVIIDTGFAGNVHTDFAVFRDAIASGVVPDTLSTDITKFSAYMRGGRYGLTMCMSMALSMGMKEEDIFKAVTVNAARALKKDGEWGCLREGANADIAVVQYCNEKFKLTDRAGNIVDGKNGYRCKLTVSDGQIVYKD